LVEHIVLIKFRPEVTETEKAEIVSRLKSLKSVIPGILDIQAGRNFSTRNQGFEVGLTVRFENREALEAYGPHPRHQEVVKRMQELGVENLIAVDFELES
jgi:heme-degrading monooxygenase HmoA